MSSCIPYRRNLHSLEQNLCKYSGLARKYVDSLANKVYIPYNRLVSAVTISMSSPWLRRVFLLDPISILWPMLLAYIVCCYFILELYYIMGTVTVDDYILANISFYIDLLYPMRCLHNICELTDNVDVFPDILHPGP